MRGGRAWVKLSGAYRITGQRLPPYDDVDPFARALIEAGPERMVWGSDWPHPVVDIPMPNDGEIMDLLARWAPDGTLERTIELPVQRPTCPMFGGAGLDIIYLTSARIFLSDEDLAKQPQAGGVFAIRGSGATGLPEPRFAG